MNEFALFFKKKCKFIHYIITLEKADPEVKAKIIKRLVHKVEVGVDKVKIHYYAGEDFLKKAVRDMETEAKGGQSQQSDHPNSNHPKRDPLVFVPNKAPNPIHGAEPEKGNVLGNLKDECSSTLTGGAPKRSPWELLSWRVSYKPMSLQGKQKL